MDRLACVDLPVLPLQLLLRRHPQWREHPVAVVDRDQAQGTLLWVNEVARHHRILPGMRYAAALSLARELRAAPVPEGEIAAARDEVLAALLHFSAGVEPSDEEPGVFWLDASGLALLHPSLEQWARQIRHHLARRGLVATVAVGFTRFGCYALARATRNVLFCRDPEQERLWARKVSIDRLDFETKTRDALTKLGVHTLGEFVDLPAPSIRRRFGADAHRLHRLAAGDLFAPLQPVLPDEPIEKRLLLDHPEADRDRLLALVAAHLAELLQTMRSRRQQLRALELHLRFEDADPRTETLRPAAPTEQSERVLELVRLRLEGRPLPAGVIELTLRLQTTRTLRAQGELFATHARRDPAAAARALARIRAELGDEAVRWAEVVQAHLPEAQTRWHTIRDLQEFPTARPRTVHHPPLVRRIFEHPVPLSRQRRNDSDGWMILGLEGGSVEEVLGPYTVSGGWWVREVHRDYHYVRTRHAGWLWVYFDRRRRRWFLQGAVQ